MDCRQVQFIEDYVKTAASLSWILDEFKYLNLSDMAKILAMSDKYKEYLKPVVREALYSKW